MYDDYDDDGDWGYNGEAEHDMWVDYTTDMYEDTNYSGENPDADIDWDAEFDANFDGHVDYDRHHSYTPPTPSSHHADTSSHMSVAQYESKIRRLEGLLAAAIAAAAVLETKSANASTKKNIRKFQYRANRKQEEISRYQAELNKLKSDYEPMKIQSEIHRTRLIAIVCAAISMIAILIAIAY